jgi:hypothetical protein
MTITEVDPTVPVANRVNVKLLRETLEWAHDQWHRWQRNEISEWEQGDWMVPTAQRYWELSDEDFQALINEGAICGTSCCVAGKVAFDLGYRPTVGSLVANPETGERELISEVARKNLRITEDEADDLFSGDNDIYDLYALAHDWTYGEIAIPDDVRQYHFGSGEKTA